MIPGSFDYHAPKTIGEAIKLLDDLGEDAKILAGGHSLIPMMKWRLAEPTHLVDISRLSGLDYIKEEDGYLCIGAMATETALETNDLIANKYSILKDTSEVIADPLVRNLATLGGNIAHGDPAMIILQPCWQWMLSWSHVVRMSPEEKLKIDDFFLGPLWTALEENEILTEIKIPMPQNDTGGCYIKLERKVGDYAIAAAAVRLEFDNEKCVSAGIALTNVGPTPVRATEAQNALIGTDVSDDLVDQASILAADASQPIGDHRGSEEYKRGVVKTLTGRAIMKAKTRAFGGN